MLDSSNLANALNTCVYDVGRDELVLDSESQGCYDMDLCQSCVLKYLSSETVIWLLFSLTRCKEISKRKAGDNVYSSNYIGETK